MKFDKCLTEQITQLCYFENKELSISLNGLIEIKPSHLIKVKFLLVKDIDQKEIDHLFLYIADGTGELFDLTDNGKTFYGNGIIECEYVATYGIFGNSFAIENFTEDSISKIRIFSDHLFDLSLTPEQSISLITSNTQFMIKSILNCDRKYSITTEERLSYVEAIFSENQTIKSALKILDGLLLLLSLCIDNPLLKDSIVIYQKIISTSQKIKELEVFVYIPLFQYDKYEKRNELYNRRNIRLIKSNMDTVFKKWNSLYEIMSGPLNVFFNSCYSDLFIDHQMLSFVSFLETFHESIYSKRNLTLKNRIIDLYKSVNFIFNYSDHEIESLAKIYKEQRNIVAHAKLGYALDKDLYKINNSLIILIQSILLNQIIDDKKIVREIIRSRLNNYILYYDVKTEI